VHDLVQPMVVDNDRTVDSMRCLLAHGRSLFDFHCNPVVWGQSCDHVAPAG